MHLKMILDSESGDELDDENLPLFFTGSATF